VVLNGWFDSMILEVFSILRFNDSLIRSEQGFGRFPAETPMKYLHLEVASKAQSPSLSGQ